MKRRFYDQRQYAEFRDLAFVVLMVDSCVAIVFFALWHAI
jgi:hypothetical protein